VLGHALDERTPCVRRADDCLLTTWIGCVCRWTARPSLRGSCPLDVAYSSLMDNNELALALRESDLDKVAVYLSRCGQQSNPKLVASGYPDVGWDPVEGERFLDFFHFCVWVNGMFEPVQLPSEAALTLWRQL